MQQTLRSFHKRRFLSFVMTLRPHETNYSFSDPTTSGNLHRSHTSSSRIDSLAKRLVLITTMQSSTVAFYVSERCYGRCLLFSGQLLVSECCCTLSSRVDSMSFLRYLLTPSTGPSHKGTLRPRRTRRHPRQRPHLEQPHARSTPRLHSAPLPAHRAFAGQPRSADYHEGGSGCVSSTRGAEGEAEEGVWEDVWVLWI